MRPPRTERNGLYHRLERFASPSILQQARARMRRHYLRHVLPSVPDTQWVASIWVSKQWLLADRISGYSPWEFASSHYSAVRDLLSSTGIPHFVESTSPYRSYAVAVRDSDWKDFAHAIGQSTATSRYYIQGYAETRRRRASSSIFPIGTVQAEASIVNSDMIRFFRLAVDETTGQRLGYNVPCVVRRWRNSDGFLYPPSASPVAEYISADLINDTVSVKNRHGVTEMRLRAAPRPTMGRVQFPIDLVYMWVDGADPLWRRRFEREKPVDAAHTPAQAERETVEDDSELGTDRPTEATAPWRFRDRDELLYSLRSVDMYAPWIRRIHIVTDRQLPRWLDLGNAKVRVHFHDEIFAEPDALPVFNSHSIGSQLHHIPNLAEHYLIMNDDMMFSAVVQPEHFFTATGLARVRNSKISAPLLSGKHGSEIEMARSNSADLMEARHGIRPSRLFTHTPIPQVLSVANSLERDFSRDFTRTMRSKFRSHRDIEPNSWLHVNELLLSGRAVESKIRYDYFLLGDATARARLSASIRHGSTQVICLNDGPSDDGRDYSQWLRSELDWAFPYRSQFELPSGRWREAVSAG